MVTGSRSGRRGAKEDDDGECKSKNRSDRGVSTSGSDTSALRRSTRETVSARKEVGTPSPSPNRKSERVVKLTANTPSPGGKAGKQSSPSPLRRSDRVRGSSSSSPGEKKASKSLSSEAKKRNTVKEKIVSLLNSETEEVQSEEVRPVRKTQKPAKFKALFKKKLAKKGIKKKKLFEDLKSADMKDPEVGFRTSDGGNVPSTSGMKPGCREANSEAENDHLALPADGLTVNLDIGPENVVVNCSEVEKEKESAEQIGLKSGQGTVSSSRKRIMLDAGSDTSEAAASKRVCTTPLPSIDKQRVDLESREGLSSCNAEDRGEQEASSAEKCDNLKQQNESLVNLQTIDDQNTCFTCKRGGKLLCCEGRGCTKTFHLSCLDPPMEEDPLGVWHCLDCVKKKLEFGVYSVSNGIESIWDSKEDSMLDVNGLTKERCFFVKYKGLSHIHNNWIPESKLLLEAPSLAKSNRKSQAVSWKQEWTVPHRLLQKRLSGKNVEACCEWLVKWRGLNYEHATWELDNSSIFNSPEGQSLVKDYENRRKRITERKNCSSEKSSQPGRLHESDNNQDYVNRLHEFWRKTQNAVVINEHANERISKVISLVQSFQTNHCGPFLIIACASSTVLRSWDDEFLQLAASLNAVVYSGNTNLRKSVRNVEFPYMQALITTLEIINEDLDILRNIQWELIITDELPSNKISSYCAQIKVLTSKRKLLVVSSQLKENTADYSNLLSLLEEHNDSSNSGSIDNIAKLKEKLSKHIVCRWKSDFSRFKEYWVPIQMSNLQVEQYCATLIRYAGVLCSANKHDSAGALRDVLRSSRKCCDHPYIVDVNTPEVLSKTMHISEYLEFGIKASGKFQFLDVMLMEMKKQGLRVLVLFHVHHCLELGKDSIGDILDDHLRQKFGPNSFERVETGIQPTKKQMALNKFNNKENGRFVFLLEARACLPSIKLSSIDMVIIFGSDWNPMNDMRALQKISLDSKPEQIPVFRLYTTFTLEENILSLAKQGRIIESNVQNIVWSTSHMLLMWGASHQFQTLDKFHRDNTNLSSPRELINRTSSKESVEEILQIISSNEPKSSSIVLNVEKVGGAYQLGSSLPGELENKGLDEGKPHIFWTKLLGGKYFQWKYLSCSSQRNRKKVKYCETDSASNETSSEVVKKRRKVVKEGDLGTDSLPRSPASRNRPENEDSVSTSHPSGDVSDVRRNYKFDTEERRELREAQNSLHLSLKPGILELCKLFKLTGNAEVLAVEFLEYMLNNHLAYSDSATTVESFQISVCWTAASIMNLKIDHRESVALARQHLNFKCRTEEAEYAYSMVKCFKSIFNYRTGKLPADFLPSSELTPELSLAETDVCKSINQTRKKSDKKLSKLIENQEEEKKKLMSSYEGEKLRIKNTLRKEKVVIGACFEDCMSMRLDKLKLADRSAAKGLQDLENERNESLKDLEVKHVAARKLIQKRGARWVEAIKAWARRELFGKTYVGPTCHWLEPEAEEVTLDGTDNHVSGNEQFPVGTTVNVPEKDAQPEVAVIEVSSDEGMNPNSGCELSVNDQITDVTSDSADDLKNEETGEIPAQQDRENAAEGEARSSVPEASQRVDHNTENNCEMPAQQDIVHAADGETVSSVPESSQMADHNTKEIGEIPALQDRENAPEGEALSSVPEASQRVDHNTENNSEMPAQQDIVHAADGETVSSVPESSQMVDRNTEEIGEIPALQDRENAAEGEALSSMPESSQGVGHNTENNCEMPALQDRVNAADGETVSSVPESSQIVDRNTEETGEVPAQLDKLNAADGETPSSVPESFDRVDRITEAGGEMVAEKEVNADAEAHQESPPVASSSAMPATALDDSNVVPPDQAVQETETQLQDVPMPTLSSEAENLAVPPSGATLTEEIERPGDDQVPIAQLVSNQPIVSLNPPVLPPSGIIPTGPSGQIPPSSRPMSNAREFNNRSPLATFPVGPPSLPSAPNPFQRECDKLHREYENIRKIHDAMNLQLEPDYQKELSEFLEQLNKKYDLKKRELGSSFSVKTREYKERLTAVLTSQQLADAFRIRCTDNKQSGRAVIQQGANSNFTQHPIQPPTQQNAPRHRHVSPAPEQTPPTTFIQVPPTIQPSTQQNTPRRHHITPAPVPERTQPSTSVQVPRTTQPPTQQNAARLHHISAASVPERTPPTTSVQVPTQQNAPRLHHISTNPVPERTPPNTSVQVPRVATLPVPATPQTTATRPPLIGSLSSYANSTQQGSGGLRSRPPHLWGTSSTLPSLPTASQLLPRPPISVEIPVIPIYVSDAPRSADRGSAGRLNDVVCLSDDD